MKIQFGGFVAVIWFVFASNALYSQALHNESSDDFNAFCKYITEKNQAKSTALKAPEAIVRVANGDINNNFQKLAIAALSKDLSDLNKARYIDRLIQEECAYYKLDQEAKLQVEFALLAIKNQALEYKLQEIQTAKKNLRQLVHSVQGRLERQNDTMRSFYEVDMSLKRLEDLERQIYIDLVSRTIPKLRPVPLHNLLRNLQAAQHNRQKTLNNIQKNDNWSVQLQAGAQQNWPTNQSQNIQPYFALLVRYNLGAMFSSSQMDHSLSSFKEWQNQQVLGTQKQLANLLSALNSMKAAEQDRLLHLKENHQKYHALSQKINKSNSLEAQHFKQQIDIDRIVMNIEIKYVQKTIDILQGRLGPK
ncbi:MAG: hypothetical protein WC627_12745 [Legionella sp.]|jgi:hypothetical protein